MTALDFGSVVLGGNVFGWTADESTSFRVLDAFVASGGRSIDTADAYSQWVPGNAGGDSEEIIGRWLERRGRRDDVEIATKVFSMNARKGLSAGNIAAAVDESLARLKTDYLDLYYAHRDDESVPQEEYLAAFDVLVQAGKVREIGASNFSADRLRSAAAIADTAGLTPFTVAQDQWNLVERGIEASLVPTLEELGIVQVPYSSLASGFLTGKYRPGVEVDSARAGHAGGYLEQPRNVELLGALDEIAQSHGTSVTAVALAWLREQPTVAAPIASARVPEQVQALVDSGSLRLGESELERLSAVTTPVRA